MKNKSRSACYAVLGLTVNASMDEVRRAYRKLAKKHHPDVNPSVDSARVFQEIQSAYEQISSGTFAASSQRVENDSARQAKAEAERKRRQRAEYLRKKERMDERAKRKQAREILVFGTAILLLAGINLAAPKVREWYVHRAVVQDPDTTLCTLSIITYREGNYRYQVDGTSYWGEVRLRKVGDRMVASSGLPLRAENQFSLVYKRSDPEKHFVLFDRPSAQTLMTYAAQTADEIDRLQQEEMLPPLASDCLVWRIYQERGVGGWADIHFAETSWLDNIENNRGTFKRLIGSQLLEQCTAR
ncbi:MAG: Chaperone protein DnaJ [Flavobacteriia bacterium]|nr:MAG: Chaperone protein DnaJ [Flavobacteriia bacterium]